MRDLREKENKDMKKKILITGSGGMVGHYVEPVFKGFDLVFTDIVGNCKKLDVRNKKATKKMILEIMPDIVLHLAAAIDVDRCEKDKTWAYECNRDGTRNVAMACKSCNATLIYLSSGSVFSGNLNRPAREKEFLPFKKYGIYHMVNGDGCSRYDIIIAIRTILNLENLKVDPISSSEFTLSAPRSRSEELENFRLKKMGLNLTRSWKDALKEYLVEEWRA